ncbi:MAG: hypothetical protein JWM44_3852 [Bacilli bacterium]|nr:hypothetical protein [Bacilli bacterium]
MKTVLPNHINFTIMGHGSNSGILCIQSEFNYLTFRKLILYAAKEIEKTYLFSQPCHLNHRMKSNP